MASKALLPGTERFIAAVSDFIFVEDEPQQCDVILVPGAAKPQHALKAAEMYHRGMAEWVLPSGRFSTTVGHFAGVAEAFREEYAGAYETEWHFLKDVLMRAGVPESAILREDQATYTWENAQFSRKVTDAMGLQVKKAMLCCRAFHARRALLYYQAASPETEFIVCPAKTPGLTREDWFLTPKGRDRVLGEVRRLGSQINEVFESMMAPFSL